ncbi:MAG: ATP-binding cassette domain-containing protein [Bacteroidales bacterium]
MNEIFAKGDVVSAYNGKIEIRFEDDFSYSENDIYLFIGPNGIGKSTLAKILTKFIDYNINGIDFSKKFLFHPQDLILLPGTVYEDYDIFLKGYDFESDIKTLGDKLNEFYVEHKNYNTSDLSGGEKQLIIMLRTILIHKKRQKERNIDGIVLDEPSKQLCNNNFQILKNDFLKVLSMLKVPMFFITHEFNLIEAIFEVFLETGKTIRFLEIRENSGAVKSVFSIGSFNKMNIEVEWEKIMNKSEYLSSFFGHSIHEFTANPTFTQSYSVTFSYPFHSGLYKVLTEDKKLILSNVAKNACSNLIPKEQICILK